MSFNFLAAVIICNDFGVLPPKTWENKVLGTEYLEEQGLKRKVRQIPRLWEAEQ